MPTPFGSRLPPRCSVSSARGIKNDRLCSIAQHPTVEFLPFGPDWARVAEIRFSENKDLPDDNGLPRRQKVRNSTVEQQERYKKDRILLATSAAFGPAAALSGPPIRRPPMSLRPHRPGRVPARQPVCALARLARRHSQSPPPWPNTLTVHGSSRARTTSKNLSLVLPLEMSLDPEEIDLRPGCLGRVFTARVISSLVSVYLLTIAFQGTGWVRDRRSQ
jgi:hypothetical protein